MCNKKLMLALTTLTMVISMSACGHKHEWARLDCDSLTCMTCGETQQGTESHSWNEATETAPKTCRNCGKTEGEPLTSGDTTENAGLEVYTKEATLYERVGGKLYVGDEFTLGTYEQDNNLDNGPEDIEWIVYEYSSSTDSYLCVSKYVLDAAVFNSTPYQTENSQYEGGPTPVDPFGRHWQKYGKENYLEYDWDTSRKEYIYQIVNDWKTSDIREWLNDEFYNKAFSEEDKINICPTEAVYRVGNNVVDCAFDSITNSHKKTTDSVSMLNWDTSNEYINRKCKATAYAVTQGVLVIQDGTRENENMCDGFYWTLDASDANGNIGARATISEVMLYDNGIYGCSADSQKVGVRPVISIKLADN